MSCCSLAFLFSSSTNFRVNSPDLDFQSDSRTPGNEWEAERERQAFDQWLLVHLTLWQTPPASSFHGHYLRLFTSSSVSPKSTSEHTKTSEYWNCPLFPSKCNWKFVKTHTDTHTHAHTQDPRPHEHVCLGRGLDPRAGRALCRAMKREYILTTRGRNVWVNMQTG